MVIYHELKLGKKTGGIKGREGNGKGMKVKGKQSRGDERRGVRRGSE